MYGHMILDEAGTGRRGVLSQERVRGMPLMCMEVPAPPQLREKALHRRLRRAGNRLWEQGVNRVLVDREFPHALWPVLESAGLHRMETEALCQEAAYTLVMALLARRGLAPAKATVCLSGSHVIGPVQTAALALAPQVGRLMIDCPGRGVELARWLNQEFGLPLVEPGAMTADITVAFTPECSRIPADLRLYGPTPGLADLCLTPADGDLPPQLEALPLLAALREHGLLLPSDIKASPLAS